MASGERAGVEEGGSHSKERDSGGDAASGGSDEGGPRWKFWLRLFAPVLAALGGLMTLRLLGPDVVTHERLHGWIAPLGPWAPLAFIAFLAVRPVTLLPGQIFTAVGGMLFGVLHATLYAMIGSLLAGILIFVLARWLGKPLMKRFAGGKWLRLQKVARRHDFSFAALITINPLVPTDVMMALSAASGGRMWPTVLGMLVGTLPGTYLTAQFGSSLGHGKYVEAAVSGGLVLVSLVIGVIVGRRVAREMREPQPGENSAVKSESGLEEEEAPARMAGSHRGGAALKRSPQAAH